MIKTPILQVALDFVDLRRAVLLAKEAVEGGVDWLEVGTPLIKSEGLNAVRTLRKMFPKKTIVADMKTMDVGRIEVESAAKAGANIVVVLGVASDATIKESVEAGRNYGAKVMVDLIDVKTPLERAKEIESFGVDFLSFHISIDKQMEGAVSFRGLKEIKKAVSIPIAVAGGINSENVVSVLNAGADVIIVGGAIIKAKDAKKQTIRIKKAMKEKKKIYTSLYKRVDYSQVRKILDMVSTANISDALHRGGIIRNIYSVLEKAKLIGPAFTVRTYPGDWAKPVEAIDLARKGDVIVIDAGGVGPAVWGELASHSAVQKGISGVVIDGGIRDVYEIRKLKFPAFSRLIVSQAGEPKGFGEVDVPVIISGVKIYPEDWIVGDDDGVVVIPKEKVIEITNRAMEVFERENRIREEIQRGGSLAEVTELLKWEKK